MRHIRWPAGFPTAFSAAGLTAAHAIEPEAPDHLISRTDAIVIYLQNELDGATKKKLPVSKEERGSLKTYYAKPGARLLWVGEEGLDRKKADRLKTVFARADTFGLDPRSYSVVDGADFKSYPGYAAEWLADAEIKISYAVLGYARDARGGRINPSRVSANLDPDLALPNPSEVIESIAIRSDPAAYLRSFQPDQPQFEALRQKLIELRGGKVEASSKPAVIIPDGPVLKLGVMDERSRAPAEAARHAGRHRRRNAFR